MNLVIVGKKGERTLGEDWEKNENGGNDVNSLS